MFEQAGIFGADFVNGEAIGLDRVGHSHVVTLEDGSAVTSHAVIITTGVGAGRYERSDQSTAPTEQLVARESLLVHQGVDGRPV
jgi:thioredoxin reductase